MQNSMEEINKIIEELQAQITRQGLNASEISEIVNHKYIFKLEIGTHLQKTIHPSSKGSFFNVAENQSEKFSGFISTSSLIEKKFDFSGNVSLSDLYKLLMLKIQNGYFFEFIKDQSLDKVEKILEKICDKKISADRLQKKVKEIFNDKGKIAVTDYLSKQVYFPIDNPNTDEYHLLSPMFSSSLSNWLYEKIEKFPENFLSFREGLKVSKKGKTNKKTVWMDFGLFISKLVGNHIKGLDSELSRSFNDWKVKQKKWRFVRIKLGSTKPQNISFLNSQQKGYHYLFESLPRTSIDDEIPINEYKFKKNLIEKSQKNLKEYIEFLKNNKGMLENKKTRQEENSYISGICKIVIDYIEELRSIEPRLLKQSTLPECFKKLLDVEPEDHLKKSCSYIHEVSKALARMILDGLNIQANFKQGDEILSKIISDIEKKIKNQFGADDE